MRRVAVPLVLACATLACNPGPPSTVDYVARLTSARAAKDGALQREAAPIPEALKATLLPLLYYPIDSRYDVAAEMRPTATAPPRSMVYSDGAVRSVRRVGTVKFLLNGQGLELSAFVEVGASEDSLFTPFGDLTNGEDTYPGGRLLDVKRTGTGIYDLDFNKAYNPSCYYSLTYSCPVPPNENKLQVRIPAGEQIKSKPH